MVGRALWGTLQLVTYDFNEYIQQSMTEIRPTTIKTNSLLFPYLDLSTSTTTTKTIATSPVQQPFNKQCENSSPVVVVSQRQPQTPHTSQTNSRTIIHSSSSSHHRRLVVGCRKQWVHHKGTIWCEFFQSLWREKKIRQRHGSHAGMGNKGNGTCNCDLLCWVLSRGRKNDGHARGAECVVGGGRWHGFS